MECPNWQGYVRLYSRNVPVRPFSFHNLQDSTPADKDWAQQLREQSRNRCGVSVDEAEFAISERNVWIELLLDS